ncbi:hypothetical protein [Streptomyces anthocyanicus]|uniref:hypothetical protein n=1 Tax=Streptomyces anthocyanicus TaxID=68174 RepID=UPI0038646F1D|nr:hypothetical protein OH747_41145 [Streptomyces anthocyanicus]
MVDNEDARKAAIASLGLKKAVPDALVTDRWFLANYAKALVIEAVKRDAPEGVVEDLMPFLRRMQARVEKIDDWAAEVLGSLEGLRDADEITPVLERALDEAPDEERKVLIARLLEKLQKPPLGLEEVLALSDEQFDVFREDPCESCCIYGCGSCPATCVICCIGSCWCCSSCP